MKGVRGGPDRRPWLIISAREARALYQAVNGQAPDNVEDLQRACSVIRRQLDWLFSGEGPSEERLKHRADVLG